MVLIVSSIQQRHAVQIENRFRFRVIAHLDAITTQAKYITHPHRRSAQNITLDCDTILIATGYLHHRRITDAGQQGAHRDTRHMAISTRTIGGVHTVDIAIENLRAFINVFRQRRIRWREFGGNRKMTFF